MNINEAFMTSQWSFKFLKINLKYLNLDLKYSLWHFIVIYELKTNTFLYYLRKNIIISKHELNICDLNFIFKKV